jgi:hypothetical protein
MLKILPPRERLQTAIAAAGLITLGAVFGALHEFGNAGGLAERVVETIAAGLGAGLVYLVVLHLLARLPERRAALWIILLGALIFRLQLLPLAPALSDDLYRHRWEGRVQAAGENPYLLAPSDPRLGALREANWQRIPGRDVASIYPPLAELVFAATYRLGANLHLAGALVLGKLPGLLGDLLVLAMLAYWVRSGSGQNWQLAVYAWNPLVVFEVAAGGHFDPLAAAALLAACLLMQRGKALGATLSLTAAVLLKWFAVVLVPLWLRRTGWPRAGRAWLCAAAAAAFALLCAWPYRSAWPQALENFVHYASRWRDNNASLYSLLSWFSGSHDFAAGLGAGIVAGLALWLAARRAEPLRAAYWLVGVILMLSPNVFSWYLLWIAPLLAMFPNPAWLLLTVLQFLSYHVVLDYHAAGAWQFRAEMLWLTYGPFYALLLWQRRRKR